MKRHTYTVGIILTIALFIYLCVLSNGWLVIVAMGGITITLLYYLIYLMVDDYLEHKKSREFDENARRAKIQRIIDGQSIDKR